MPTDSQTAPATDDTASGEQPFLDSGGHTDAGASRDINDDAFLIADLSRALTVSASSTNVAPGTAWFESSQGKLMVVADGITGAGAAELASSVALTRLAEHVTGAMPWPADDRVEAELSAALAACQREVKKAARARGLETAPVGTSVTIAYVAWPTLHIAHAGDCRGYVLRERRIERLTSDDTLAQKLVERDILAPEAAERWDNVLVNAVGGGDDDLEIEYHRRRLSLGDQILLCSDGVTAHVDDLEISQVLSESITAATAARRLVELAVERGADGRGDNATAAITRVERRADTSPVTFS